MLKLHKYEDKTYDLVLEKCVKDLNIVPENLYIRSAEIEEGKLFKTKKIQISVITKDEVRKYIREFIKTIEIGMGISIQVEIKEDEGIFQVVLASEENGILIGKDGRTINSLQLLLRQSINIDTDFNIKINLDAGNYKVKKIRNFEYEMKKIIKEVSMTKLDASLDPMNSYERRIVHNLVSQFENVSSSSDGEGRERHITIHYNN